MGLVAKVVDSHRVSVISRSVINFFDIEGGPTLPSIRSFRLLLRDSS